MQKSLFIKAMLVLVIFVVLQIPLKMIDGVVAERSARQQAVVQELSSGSYGRVVLAGPILSVPFVEEYSETLTEGHGTILEKRRVTGVARFFPKSNSIDGSATVETKARGLFKARVFSWRATVRGEFMLDGKPELRRTHPDSRIIWGEPTVSVLLNDPRGLQGTPSLDWSGQELAFERGSGLAYTPSGLHAGVPEFDPMKPQRFGYTLVVGLRGTESLSLVPLAAEDRMTLHSDWPHPSFGGQFLPSPESYGRRDDGFDAQWTVTALASKAQQQLIAILDAKPECRAEGFCADRIEVRFIEPIDIYSLSDRALKYGFLFVGFTFGCLVLYEILKGLPIHPAQYLLVGLALATFFLLLIGLSEHIAFWIAYLIASVACIALLGFYLSAILNSIRNGLAFSVMLTALYSTLYGLLISEDNALLMGSLLVFASIATAMVLTRNVDWYALRSPDKPYGSKTVSG
jgi:inner membrane protein